MSRLIAYIPPSPGIHVQQPECLVQVDPKQLHEVPAITALLAKAISINFIVQGALYAPCICCIHYKLNKHLNKEMTRALTPDMAR